MKPRVVLTGRESGSVTLTRPAGLSGTTSGWMRRRPVGLRRARAALGAAWRSPLAPPRRRGARTRVALPGGARPRQGALRGCGQDARVLTALPRVRVGPGAASRAGRARCAGARAARRRVARRSARPRPRRSPRPVEDLARDLLVG